MHRMSSSSPCGSVPPLTLADAADLLHSRDCLEANEAVRVCFNSSGVGLVRVVQPPTNDSVFVLRIGGPHPQTALIERSSSLGSAIWAAPFRLCRPGPYTVHVRLLIDDEPSHGKDGVAFTKQCPTYEKLSSHMLDRFEFSFYGGQSKVCQCDDCLWTWRSSHGSMAARASLSTFSNPLHIGMPRGSSIANDFSELRFVDRAAWKTIGSRWFRERSQQQWPLCLVGDSHTRNLANSIIVLATPGGDCEPLEAQGGKALCASQVPGQEIVKFLRATGESDLKPATPFDTFKLEAFLQGCAGLVVNYGQWQLSHERSKTPPRVPCTLEQYGNAVRQTLNWLARQGVERGIPVAWISMNPTPLFGVDGGAQVANLSLLCSKAGGAGCSPLRHMLCNEKSTPSEWRLPHYLNRYNLVARAACEAENISYLNNFPLALDLLDLSFDAQHYQDPVGRQLAARVVHWLKEAQARAPAPAQKATLNPKDFHLSQSQVEYFQRLSATCFDSKGDQWCNRVLQMSKQQVRKHTPAAAEPFTCDAYLRRRCNASCGCSPYSGSAAAPLRLRAAEAGGESQVTSPSPRLLPAPPSPPSLPPPLKWIIVLLLPVVFRCYYVVCACPLRYGWFVSQ